MQIADPFLASYAIENPIYAVTHLAEFVAGSEICKITLDKTFKERDTLNHNIMVPTTITPLSLVNVMVLQLI